MARKKQKTPKPPPNPRDRLIYKEIIGIFLLFLVLFTVISLLSYRNTDPSFFNSAPLKDIHNLFGLMGAYMSGLLIHLVGLGSFWIPVLMFLISLQLFGSLTRKALATRILGGMILVIGTAVFFALWRDHYLIFGGRYSAGGILGGSLGTAMVRYSSHIGSAVILALVLTAGFILATGLSMTASAAYLSKLALAALKGGIRGTFAGLKKSAEGMLDLWRKWRERRKQRAETKKARDASKKWTINKDTDSSKPLRLKKRKKEPVIVTPRSTETASRSRGDRSEQLVLPLSDQSGFHLPPLSFLDNPKGRPSSVDRGYLLEQARLLEQKLGDFGVKGEVEDVIPGPVITTFEYKPAAGVKINRIVNLSDDLALALKAMSVRIVAPIPGKAVIGIEIPNTERETVRLRELVSTDGFRNSPSKLTISLGKDIVGNPVVAQLEKMPHLLIAGATGTGKSVFLNSLICSILYKATPDEVKLIMVDPKRIELSEYDGIPHLITPVVIDVKKATNALFWAVSEMERRYELLSENRVRNITQFNRKAKRESGKEIRGEDGELIEAPLEPLPFIVVIIDELADLMVVASRDVEVSLMRLAQMARAAGIHLILATQRPSVDVLTGIIKANFPTRLTFQVSSKTDSRTIIDTNGAETLLGEGDMLYLPPGTAKLQRIHGAYLSEEELTKITDFLKKQKAPEYDSSVVEAPTPEKGDGEEEEYDERYDDAVALVTKTGHASISMVQRHLRVGYNRAARIIEVMEREGIVGPADGAKPRDVLVGGYDDIPLRSGQ